MTHLKEKIGAGLSPQVFIENMTVNREKLEEWYRRFEWNQEDLSFFQQQSSKQSFRAFILAADWCGDVVKNVPVLFRVLEEAQIPTEILIIEQHSEVMDQFLTLGGRSIPILIFTDADGNVLGKWGPRPAYVQEPMVEFKQLYPNREGVDDYEAKITEVYKEIGKRYGQGTAYQNDIVKEVRELLTTISS